MITGMKIVAFGSSLVSAYWNGAATYYRGIFKALHARGHRITFLEPDAYDRQKHRDIDDPPYAKSIVYAADSQGLAGALKHAEGADLVIKMSGVGVFDDVLEKAVLEYKNSSTMVMFWDVDAPATLDRISLNPSDAFHQLIPEYDMILTYGGGNPVIDAYRSFGARDCVPVYNGLDPETHFPIASDNRFTATLGFIGNRLPDREARVEEFFFKAARELPDNTFILGGNGWNQHSPGYSNVRILGHIYTADHNAFNCTPLAVLNVNRQSMAHYGYSPPTRIFEAAGAGACIICDAWEGIEQFLTPGTECLVAHNGLEVAELLKYLDKSRAHIIGYAARNRVLAEHTYEHRGEAVEQVIERCRSTRKKVAS